MGGQTHFVSVHVHARIWEQ